MSEALKIRDAHPEQKIFDGEIEPPMPDKAENNKTILGVDSNNNGIRDDVEIWINRTGKNYNERMAMRQYAKAQNFWLSVCANKKLEAVEQAENGLANSGTCLRFFGEKNYEKIRFNENRLKAIIQNNSMIDCNNFYKINSLRVTIINASEEYLNCKFKIENLNLYIK